MILRAMSAVIVAVLLAACGGSTTPATTAPVITDEAIHVFSADVTPEGITPTFLSRSTTPARHPTD